MHYRLIGAWLVIIWVATACNLGQSQPETDLPTEEPEQAQPPQVQITAPQDGATFAVNEQIVVTVQATDGVGITNVRLFANGSIVRTVSPIADAATNYSGTLDFTPRTTGEYQLRVVAYRGAVASQPDDITVNVTQTGSDGGIQLTQRPTDDDNTGGGDDDDSGRPVIPNDGVCRALILVNLNFRTQPTTARDNVITTLPEDTLAPVTARLGDNSWWKIIYGTQVGWVSANPQFTTLYGNCSNVPVENVIVNTATPTLTPFPTTTPFPTFTPAPIITDTPVFTPTPQPADLVIVSIAGNRELLIPTDAESVSQQYGISVSNQGAGDSGQFIVRLQVDEQTFNFPVSSLRPRESFVITQEVTFDAPGQYDLRVTADVNDDVEEISEVNNLNIIIVEVSQIDTGQ